MTEAAQASGLDLQAVFRELKKIEIPFRSDMALIFVLSPIQYRRWDIVAREINKRLAVFGKLQFAPSAEECAALVPMLTDLGGRCIGVDAPEAKLQAVVFPTVYLLGLKLPFLRLLLEKVHEGQVRIYAVRGEGHRKLKLRGNIAVDAVELNRAATDTHHITACIIDFKAKALFKALRRVDAQDPGKGFTLTFLGSDDDAEAIGCVAVPRDPASTARAFHRRCLKDAIAVYTVKKQEMEVDEEDA